MKNRLSFFSTILLLFFLHGCFQTSSERNTTTNEYAQKFQKQNFNLNTVEDLYKFLTYDDNSYPIVSAHRGGAENGYPENAIETFAHIAGKMPAIIECDVRITRDSMMVLMHDETLDRTTNGSGKVQDHTLTELKDLKLKDTDGRTTSYRIPTLEEALIWGRGQVIFTLDVKKGVSYQKIAELIAKTEASAYSIIITYNANQAVAMHRIAPELMISASIKSEKDLLRLYNADIPDNKLVAFVGTQKPDKKLVNALHNHGIKIILGALGNLDRQASAKGHQTYAELIEEGSDIISTDRPLEAFKALDFYIRKRRISSPYINN